jgi:hypothetical protein
MSDRATAASAGVMDVCGRRSGRVACRSADGAVRDFNLYRFSPKEAAKSGCASRMHAFGIRAVSIAMCF